MTRPNQGLSSLALGGGERETLGTRLFLSYQNPSLDYPNELISLEHKSNCPLVTFLIQVNIASLSFVLIEVPFKDKHSSLLIAWLITWAASYASAIRS